MPPHAPTRAHSTATQRLIQEGATLSVAGKTAEAIACFEKALKDNPRNPHALLQLGQALLRANDNAKAAAVLARAVAERPDSAENRFALGLALQATHRPVEATACFRVATNFRPDWAEAWSHLGHSLGGERKFDEAEAALRHALTLKGYRAETLNHLGVVTNARGNPEEAIEIYLQAIKCKPTLFQAWTNLGNALRALNQLEEALVAYQHSLANNPKNAFVKFNVALVHLLQGKLSREAWLRYEYRWITLNYNPHRGFSQPLWRGEEPIAGKSILLYAEQGLGDTIQFARFAKTLADQGATVHIEVQAALKPLLQGTPGAASVIAIGEPLPYFDFHCPLLSVPFALDTRLETIPGETPYITAPVERTAKWSAKIPRNGRLRVGFVWRGNPRHTNDANRSIALARFQNIFAATDCDFYSLQLGPSEAEAGILATHANCIDLTREIADFEDTAAFIKELDVVLAVDTSVAHLAGALGQRVWLLLPFSPDWRWLLNRDDSPWYPGMRLFRQPAIGDWENALQQVTVALAADAGAHQAAA